MLTELLLIYPLNDYKNPLDISTANNSPDSETDFGTVCIVLGLTLAEQIFSWQKITPGNINKSFIGENWTRKQQSYMYLPIRITFYILCQIPARRGRVGLEVPILGKPFFPITHCFIFRSNVTLSILSKIVMYKLYIFQT